MTVPQHGLSHPKYRPDIDGLRALAVLSVVAFHAFPGGVTGGFVGVDIFFVISGFLISTILFENLEKGTFSFAEFYARRVKRIFPALVLVLIGAYLFGWISLVADEYKHLGKHIVAGSGFFSNIALLRESGYFDTSSETKPLLHLWSLGIEEQFYIVWPLLLWASWKLRFNLLLTTTLVALASFYLNVVGMQKHAIATFYSPQTRFWELLSGSGLAWLSLYKRNLLAGVQAGLDRRLNLVFGSSSTGRGERLLVELASGLGVVLLAISIFGFNKSLSFPGKWAVFPVLGAVLVIAAGPRAWLNRNVLSHPIAVWFGLISFPLYLWHWPLLSFSWILQSEAPSQAIRLADVALAVLLAWMTYRLVERPIRSGRRGNLKIFALAGLMTLVASTGYLTYRLDGFRFREVEKLNAALDSGADGGDGHNTINECGIEQANLKKAFAGCSQDKRPPIKYALLGDSKAAALWPGLVRTSTEQGRWVFIGGNGPHGAPVPLLSPDPALASFRRMTTTAVDAIVVNKSVQTVVLVSAVRQIFQLNDVVKDGNLETYDPKYLAGLAKTPNYERTLDGFDRTISRLVDAGKKVVLVVDNPALPEPEDCVGRKTSIDFINAALGSKNDDCYVPLSLFLEQTALYRKLLSELQRRHPNDVDVFDATDVLCDTTAGVCGPIRDNRLLYSYGDHISDYAAGRIGVRLNAFLNSR